MSTLNVEHLKHENSISDNITLDSAGHVGIGVTPSTWAAPAQSVLEFPNGANIFSSVTSVMQVSANNFYDGAYKYKTNGFSSRYRQDTGAHFWSTAPSGTAGAGITYTTAMTLDASGRLTIPSQPYICRRVTTGNVTAPQLIPWDTEIGSSGIVYNTGTRRFTVPVAGRYKITGSFFKAGGLGSTAARVCLGVNSDEPNAAANLGHTYSGQDAVYHSMSFDVILSLSANDFFTFRLTDGPLYCQLSDQFNFMSAHMIG